MSEAIAKPKPVSLRTDAERYAHVVSRLMERGSITWTVEQVAHLEKKIKMVRTMVNLRKQVAGILPTKIGEEKEGQSHFYRVLIAGAPHTFVWSQICRGVVSYRGPGELNTPTVVLPVSRPISRFRDLSGCDPV